MNQKFNTISIILVVILVALLIYVMASYYTKADPVSSGAPLNMTETDILVTSGDENAIMSNYVGTDESGETIIPNSGNEENITSGDGVIDVLYNDEPKTPAKSEEKLIITSDENISDKEKKQVLHELDQTLMDLLDVVDKVQTVDESRLGEESEVQPWESFY